jgi:hypothetical protein
MTSASSIQWYQNIDNMSCHSRMITETIELNISLGKKLAKRVLKIGVLSSLQQN